MLDTVKWALSRDVWPNFMGHNKGVENIMALSL